MIKFCKHSKCLSFGLVFSPRNDFCSFKKQKLIELVTSFNDFDIDSYILPNNDPHNSEYLAENDKRIQYISGFSGSNAFAFISNSEAILWTDSRYFIQAKKELEPEWCFKEISPKEKKWYEFIKEKYKSGDCFKIGVDPSLISAASFEDRQKEFSKFGINLKSVDANLVDKIWKREESKQKKQVYIHDTHYSGMSTNSKISLIIAKAIEEDDSLRFLLSTELDEIAWLLNLRGEDIPYNPVFKSYFLLEFDSSKKFDGWLFIDLEKVTPKVSQYLAANCINIKPYEEIANHLKIIDQNILIDKNSCNYKLVQTLQQRFIINKKSPIKALKAIKNQTEIDGYRKCHLRDGLSVISFFTWLSHQLKVLKRGNLSEYEAALKCDEFRSLNDNFKALSFKTISATGPNSAIVHYSPEKSSSDFIKVNSMFLLDSGGHYLDGTTDLTRTIHLGIPSLQEKTAYTLVLIGNLNLERTIWPTEKQVSGSDLDVIARRSLWKHGLDYGHGTGHGVGYFLNVHEGPHGINKKATEPLKENMIVTNEPGYYLEGAFGIRIENCLLIQKSEIKDFLKFENLSLVPYDLNLIDISLLQKEDILHINNYHKKIYETYLPTLERNNKTAEITWLKKATTEIKMN